MVSVAQLVRASDCGSEGRGFESHRSPQDRKKAILLQGGFFYVHLVKNLPSILLFPDHTELCPKYE